MSERLPGRAYDAPAKLNLFLHVVGRRSDGYHLLQSVMQRVDLCDTLTIAATDDGRIVRIGGLADVDVDDDLAVRAARLLQGASGTVQGATIAIDKRIPVGGGLGGGSSDAASVLLALNAAWDLRWSRARLAEVGLSIGADVPFFVHGGDAFVEGIGERITPLAMPRSHYALVHPGISVPTALIFGDAGLTRDTVPLKISDFSDAAPTAPSRSHANPVAARLATSARYVNDLQAVATRLFEPVARALAWLEHDQRADDERFEIGDARRDGSNASTHDVRDWPGAIGPARMSGSGACVFRAFATREAAAACIARLPDRWRGWAVSSFDQDPASSGTNVNSRLD